MMQRFQSKWSIKRQTVNAAQSAASSDENLTKPHQPRAVQQRTGYRAYASELSSSDIDLVPQAQAGGTIAALVTLAGTALTLSGNSPSQIARYAAYGGAAALALSLAFDLRRGFQNLIRADVMALLALYFLTFFEFFFPQPNFDIMISNESTCVGVYAVLTGFAGLLIGRHLWKPASQPFSETLTREIPAQWLLTILWGSFALGFFHQVIAVQFDPVEWVDQMMAPRFSQPWQRGQLGDWKALLVELQLFIYLIPPLCGIIFARRYRFTTAQLGLVGATFLFTLFYGFTGGTRNVFASYLVTFLIGYAFAAPPNRKKELFVIAATSALAFLSATVLMLEFRTVGFKNWLDGTYIPPESRERTLFIDYNLYAICRITEAFPKHRDYLGVEIPFNAIIRPIPRALWPGKPERLSITIEETLGVEGLTIAASFVGEAYMAGGFFGVLGAGVVFGAISGWWSFIVSRRNSELGILIYASGFFAAVISMRSLFTFTTALLPTVAALVIGSYLVGQIRERRQQRLQPIPRDGVNRYPPR